MVGVFLKNAVPKQLFCRRPFALVDCQTLSNNHSEVLWVIIRYLLILPPLHLLKQTVHIFRLERRLQHSHFISHTSQRPNVTLHIVRLVPPHLRRGIVRCPSLGINQSHLGYLTHVHVSKFVRMVLANENICTLQVPVENFILMQDVEGL